MLTLSSEITWGSNRSVDLPPKPRLLTLVAVRSQHRASLEFPQDFAQCFDKPTRESRAGRSTLAYISGGLGLQACLSYLPAGCWVSHLTLPRSCVLHIKRDTQWYQVIFTFLCTASFSESKNSTKHYIGSYKEAPPRPQPNPESDFAVPQLLC